MNFILANVLLAAAPVLQGKAITLDDILALLEKVAGFLIFAGEIIAAIVIVYSGIVYMTAGSDPTKIKTAKDTLKSGLIGALIVFGVGVIINTVSGFAFDPLGFFR